MALNPWNSSSLEQLALKEFSAVALLQFVIVDTVVNAALGIL